MVYIYDRLDQYTDEAYQAHLSLLPEWRKEKALQYKKLDDRKRSVLVFNLLQYALQEEYGISEVSEFVYNKFGKPFLLNMPIYFSLSHCKDVVACAVSEHEVGIDVENIVPYNSNVAQRVCNVAELDVLQNSKNKDADFIRLWTKKEAISKYEGLGLSLSFNNIMISDYYITTQDLPQINCAMSVCYGNRNNVSLCSKFMEVKHYLL